MISKNSKIYIAGHKGMVGSAVLRKLESNGFQNLIFQTLEELDLRSERNVEKFMKAPLFLDSM